MRPWSPTPQGLQPTQHPFKIHRRMMRWIRKTTQGKRSFHFNAFFIVLHIYRVVLNNEPNVIIGPFNCCPKRLSYVVFPWSKRWWTFRRLVHHAMESVHQFSDLIATKCGEDELVRGVNTLVAGVVQVYLRLHVVKNEEKWRKVEREVEKGGVKVKRPHGWPCTWRRCEGANFLSLSHGACVCGWRQDYADRKNAHDAQWMWLQVCASCGVSQA